MTGKPMPAPAGEKFDQAERARLEKRCVELELSTLVWLSAALVQHLRGMIDEHYPADDGIANTMRALHVAYTELMLRLAPDEFRAALDAIYPDEVEEAPPG